MSDQLHEENDLSLQDQERQIVISSPNGKFHQMLPKINQIDIEQESLDNLNEDEGQQRLHKHHKSSHEHKSKKNKKHKKDKKSKKRKHRDHDDANQEQLQNQDESNLPPDQPEQNQDEEDIEAELARIQAEIDQLNQQGPSQRLRKNEASLDEDNEGVVGLYSDDEVEDGKANKKSERKRLAKIKMMEQKEKQRQKMKEKQQELDAQRKMEEEKLEKYNEKQKELYLKINSKTTKQSQKSKLNGDEIDLKEDEISSNDAQNLIDRMHMAYILDREAIEQKKPGLKKLLMAKEVYETLRKLGVQERFLELGGCRVLSEWLDMLPDGTFPNFNLAQGMLNCILTLKIDSNQLDESNLAPTVQYYEVGAAKMPELQRLAKQIIDKWSRQLYNIRSRYDADGQHDAQYRQYQLKLHAQKEKQQHINQQIEKLDKKGDGDEDFSDDELNGKKGKSASQQDDKKSISRGRTGIMLPERAAFDFVYPPDAKSVNAKARKKENESGKARLQKTLLQLKKSNTKSTTSSKGMATVKINY